MTLTVPTSLSDLTLGQYMALQDAGEDRVAQVAILCRIPQDQVKKLTKATLNQIDALVGHIEGVDEEKYPLTKFVELRGRKYGFHPNLEEISVGEFIDLESLCEDAWTNLPRILSILYRPVTSEALDLYTIAKYTGNEDPTVMEEMTMDVVLGCLAFFLTLGLEFVRSSRQSLTEEARELNSQRSGDGTLRSTTSQGAT